MPGPAGFAAELNTAPAPKNCSTQSVEVSRPDTGPLTVFGTSATFGVFHEDQNSMLVLPPANVPVSDWSSNAAVRGDATPATEANVPESDSVPV